MNNTSLLDLSFLNDPSSALFASTPAAVVVPAAAQEEVPRFLRMLYVMVGNPDCDSIVRWAHNGTALEINVDILSDHILPNYFSVQKFSSFQRQLNYFGFRKWTKTQTDICTFSHPDFLQYEPERIRQIRRGKRSPSPRKSNTSSSMYTTPVAKSITTAPSMSWAACVKTPPSKQVKSFKSFTPAKQQVQMKRSLNELNEMSDKIFKKQKNFEPATCDSLLFSDDDNLVEDKGFKEILDCIMGLPDDADQFLLSDSQLKSLEVDISTDPTPLDILNDSLWIESLGNVVDNNTLSEVTTESSDNLASVLDWSSFTPIPFPLC